MVPHLTRCQSGIGGVLHVDAHRARSTCHGTDAGHIQSNAREHTRTRADFTGSIERGRTMMTRVTRERETLRRGTRIDGRHYAALHRAVCAGIERDVGTFRKIPGNTVPLGDHGSVGLGAHTSGHIIAGIGGTTLH